MTKHDKKTHHRFKHILFLILGSLAVLLGSIGILIPVLPTTPFLLLAAYFYLGSSRRLYEWLIHHRILGKYIYHYLEHKAVPVQTKIGAILILWVSLTASMVLVDILLVRIILPVIGLAVSVHILTLKTLRTGHNGAGKTAEETPFEDPLL
ncbi:MAG: DUF454 domain-containing protein [Clostridia bacterium]|nr:DUF454 domain-containing protein [Clostridia bacterium]NCC75034.1 DUF454 domain-containing protein [Clostridia bacterium]